MAGLDETFYDARDWEEEVRILEDKVEEGKRVVREGKKREKSWENEVVELRREWERGRHENIMLKNDIDVRKLEGEIKAFRSDSVRQRRVQDGLTMRKNALEQEVLDMRSEVDRGRKALKIEKQKNGSLQGRVDELERVMKKSDRKISEQREMINEWERKQSEAIVKENMQREIRDRIEFEEQVRDEVIAKRRKT